MKKLRRAIMSDENKRNEFIEDCMRLVDSAVMAQTGIRGFALKNAYKMGLKSHPTIIRDAFEIVVDDFIARLEPYYAQYRKQSHAQTFGEYLEQRDHEVAAALLEITDAKAREVNSPTIVGFYHALRPQAQKHVASVAHSIGALVERHVH